MPSANFIEIESDPNRDPGPGAGDVRWPRDDGAFGRDDFDLGRPQGPCVTAMDRWIKEHGGR